MVSGAVPTLRGVPAQQPGLSHTMRTLESQQVTDAREGTTRLTTPDRLSTTLRLRPSRDSSTRADTDRSRYPHTPTPCVSNPNDVTFLSSADDSRPAATSKGDTSDDGPRLLAPNPITSCSSQTAVWRSARTELRPRRRSARHAERSIGATIRTTEPTSKPRGASLLRHPRAFAHGIENSCRLGSGGRAPRRYVAEPAQASSGQSTTETQRVTVQNETNTEQRAPRRGPPRRQHRGF